jgi:AraC-like DNA-binding protein
MPDSEERTFPTPDFSTESTEALPRRDREEEGSREIAGAAGVTTQKIVFNSAELEGDDVSRKDEWVALLSSGYARMHADPAADMPFNGELQIAVLDEIAVGTIRGTVKTFSRTAPDIAAENTDNVLLFWNAGACPIRIEQGSRSEELAQGSSVLIEQCEPTWVKVAAGTCNLLALQAPRRRVRSRFPGLDDRFMIPMSGRSATMLLMRAYANALIEQSPADKSLLARFAPEHIIDLIAASVDATRTKDGESKTGINAEIAQRRGIAAARLHAIKTDIREHLDNCDLSISLISARHGISPRYIRTLFERDHTTFTDFVLNQRLARVHRCLVDPRFAGRMISTIAFEAGFGDLSYFNHAFRRRYAATPSDIRAAARQN